MANPLAMLLAGQPEQQELPELDLNDPTVLAQLMQDQETGPEPTDHGFAPSGQEQTLPSTSPELQAGQPSGQWGSWLESPANRSFLLNMGLQLMSGGWGGWGNQVARAIAAGYQGAHATESGATIDAQGRTRLAQQPRQPLGRPRTRVGAPPQETISRLEVRRETERADLTALTQLLMNPNLTEQEWAQHSGEGGLLHRAGFPNQPFTNKDIILTQVQRRLHQLPRRGGTVSSDELLRLGLSEDPRDQLDFQILAGSVLRPPRAGHEYYVDRETRTIRQRPNTTGSPSGPGGTTSQRAALGAMTAGLQSLDDIQAALANTNPLDRAAGRFFNAGVWGRIEPQIEIITRALMHGLSGAQVSIAETQAYLNAFRPDPLRPADWPIARINYKLNHARQLLVAILGAQGQQISPNLQLQIRNSLRTEIGLPELTMEQHLQSLGQYGLAPQVRPQGQPVTPPVAPGTVAPPRPPVAPPVITPPPDVPPTVPRPSWATEPPPGAPTRPGPDWFWNQEFGTWMRQRSQ